MEKETVIQPENRRRPSLKQPPKSRIVTCTWFRALVWALPLFVAAALAPFNATAQEKAAAGASGHKDLGAVGAKLANPLSNLWSISMNFQMPQFYDGDVNTGDPEFGANMIFQPVLPIPLLWRGGC